MSEGEKVTAYKDSDLNEMAATIADQIEQSQFSFAPKRFSQIVGYHNYRGWRRRLSGYRYKKEPDPFFNWQDVRRLSAGLCGTSRSLTQGATLSSAEMKKAEETTLNVFKWGGVTRGKGHGAPCFDDIGRVMLSATSYACVRSAPMDSAWTKLAALSSAWHDDDPRRPPQVIFDSRVSVALIEAIDRACANQKGLRPLRDNLRAAGLGYVPGRGGTRPQRIEALRDAGWKNGYGRWDAQFAASRLVFAIAGVLNQGTRFERMSTPEGDRDWDVRGVEMVLFMDGY